MKPTIPARDAFTDPDLLAHVMQGDSWRPQRTLLMAALGETLTEDERVIFKQFTGRDREPGRPVSEFCTIAGRRTGKTQMISAAATYLSGLCSYDDVLAGGETGTLLCLAQDQRVAAQILDYCEENFAGSKILSQLVVGRTQDTIQLRNHLRIEVRPASFRKLRGPTYVAIIADELGYWFSDDFYQNTDVEVLAAARPGLLTTHGMVIMASSPYGRKGVLWETFKKHYGPTGSPAVIVAKGTSVELNPTLDREEIERAIADDPERNTAEYLAEFRSDLASYVSPEAVEACISSGVRERPPQRGQYYFGFTDPAGGSGKDSMTLSIGHLQSGTQVLTIDALREARPPFSPEVVTGEFSELLKSYGITSIISDRTGLGWSKEMFAHHGITCEQNAEPKTALYTNFLPLINSVRVELLDHQRSIDQLCALERSTSKIDHPPNGHDDLINAIAGVASISINKFGGYDHTYSWVDGLPAAEPDGGRFARATRWRQYLQANGMPPWARL